jgi:hypothetical protein
VPAATFRLRSLSIIYSTTLVRAGSLRRQLCSTPISTHPYFHDGRYDSYERVVEHFDRLFGLELTGQDQADLVAYLHMVGAELRELAEKFPRLRTPMLAPVGHSAAPLAY